MAHSK